MLWYGIKPDTHQRVHHFFRGEVCQPPCMRWESNVVCDCANHTSVLFLILLVYSSLINLSGATTLVSQVSPNVASATAGAHSPLYHRGSVAYTPGAHSYVSRTTLRNTLPDSGSESASVEAPHTVELPTVRKWAATGLAPVLAAVLMLVNRLRLKRSPQPANAMY